MSGKLLSGVVVSNKSSKTVTVLVKRTVLHPVYKKVIVLDKKYMVHDENNSGKVGDLVKIVACRPMSAAKRWKLVDGSL